MIARSDHISVWQLMTVIALLELALALWIMGAIRPL